MVRPFSALNSKLTAEARQRSRASGPGFAHCHFFIDARLIFGYSRRMIRFWRLNERIEDNLGLACTDDGLFLGRTPLIERRDKHYVVRERGEIERLLKRAYRGGGPAADRLVPGLATVAAALNADDQCLARIAAVHLQILDLPSEAARDGMEAEDVLIKSGDWNPSLHPRTGTPPNPGWFAPTDSGSEVAPPLRLAQNEDRTGATDATLSVTVALATLAAGRTRRRTW
jgi:hypothetical protein